MAKAPSLETLHPLESLGNAPARRGEIRVERLESRLRPKVPFPHRHDFYHFVYVERGRGWHEIDFVRYPVKAGQLFCVKPGEVHAWELGAGTRGFVVEFTEESRGKMAAPIPALSYPEGLAPLLALMREEFRGASPGYQRCLEHYLAVFLLHVARGGEAPQAPRRALPLVAQFRELVEAHFRREHSVEFYANQLGVPPKRLTTLCARALGQAAGAVVQERCLLEAKRLLAYSDLPVAEVGYALGFEDPNYFARFFRQRSGLAPGKFRERARHSVH